MSRRSVGQPVSRRVLVLNGSDQLVREIFLGLGFRVNIARTSTTYASDSEKLTDMMTDQIFQQRMEEFDSGLDRLKSTDDIEDALSRVSDRVEAVAAASREKAEQQLGDIQDPDNLLDDPDLHAYAEKHGYMQIYIDLPGLRASLVYDSGDASWVRR